MDGSMVAAVIHGARDVRVEAVARQEVAAGEAEVAVAVGGICGSDLSYFTKGAVGDFRLREPMILGHEVVGVVAAVGSPEDKSLIGKRVAVDPSATCGACPPCLAGRSNICVNVRFLGSAARFPHVQGAFCERLVVRTSQLEQLPDSLPFESAVFAEPLSVAVHGVNRAGELSGGRVLVVGAGPIGLLVTLVARYRGAADVTVADIRDAALDTARQVGATATVNTAQPDAVVDEADVVFEASGSAAGLVTALRAASRGGTVVQLGLLPAKGLEIPGNVIVTKELDVRGSFRFTRAEFSESVAMLANGLEVSPMLSASIPIAQAEEALAFAADRATSVKVQLIVG